MEYTSELSVIKAGHGKFKNSFFSSVIIGIISVFKNNIKSTKFWLTLFFFTLITVLFSVIFYFSYQSNSGLVDDFYYTNTFAIISIIFFSILIILSVLVIPFIFKRTSDFDKKISDQISASSYWGLIIGKYIGTLLLFSLFILISSILVFCLLIGVSLGENILLAFSKTLQLFIFGILFTSIWIFMFISFGVYFDKAWQSSTFIIGIMFTMLIFIPFQTIIYDQKPTSTNVSMNDQGEVVKNKIELTTYSYIEDEKEYYAYFAPFNIFALTSSMYTIFDGNFTNDYIPSTTLDNLVSPVEKQDIKGLYFNKIDYSTLYAPLPSNTNESSEFGQESEIKNKDLYIVDYNTYLIGNEIKSTYNSINNNSDFSQAVNSLASTANDQWNEVSTQYTQYLNDDFGDTGNYNISPTEPSIIPEIQDGIYLSLSDFISTLATHDATIDTSTLNNEQDYMQTIVDYFGYEISDVNDWNYIKGISIMLTDTNINTPWSIPPKPSITSEEENLRANAHSQGYTGAMNTTLYEVDSSPYLEEWAYILIYIGVAILLFFAASWTIQFRNYY